MLGSASARSVISGTARATSSIPNTSSRRPLQTDPLPRNRDGCGGVLRRRARHRLAPDRCRSAFTIRCPRADLQQHRRWARGGHGVDGWSALSTATRARSRNGPGVDGRLGEPPRSLRRSCLPPYGVHCGGRVDLPMVLTSPGVSLSVRCPTWPRVAAFVIGLAQRVRACAWAATAGRSGGRAARARSGSSGRCSRCSGEWHGALRAECSSLGSWGCGRPTPVGQRGREPVSAVAATCPRGSRWALRRSSRPTNSVP